MQGAESSSLLWLDSCCHILHPCSDELRVPSGALLWQTRSGLDNSSDSVKACFVYKECEILCLFVLRPVQQAHGQNRRWEDSGRKTQQVENKTIDNLTLHAQLKVRKLQNGLSSSKGSSPYGDRTHDLGVISTTL